MSSKQIGLYGLIGGLLLIVFLVLFFGQDIKKIVTENDDNSHLLKSEIEAALEANSSLLGRDILLEKVGENSFEKRVNEDAKEVIKETFAKEQESLILENLLEKKEQNISKNSTKSLVVTEEENLTASHPTEYISKKGETPSAAPSQISTKANEKAHMLKIDEKTTLQQFEENTSFQKRQKAQDFSNKEVVLEKQKYKISSEVKEKEEDIYKQYNQKIKTLLLQSTLFHKSIHRLDREDQNRLKEVVKLLKAFPNAYSLDIEGYVESGQSLQSSETMAKIVKSFLQKSFPSLSIRAQGYGDEYPILDKLDAIENRRIEIKIRRK